MFKVNGLHDWENPQVVGTNKLAGHVNIVPYDSVDAARAGDAAALTLEGLALMATTRLAPARLAASMGGIEAARSALQKIRGSA